MGKKRGKDKSSREEDDNSLTASSCSHIRKAIDHSFLKKCTLSSSCNICQDCKDEARPAEDSSQEGLEETEGPAVWMCLKCGHRGCGRSSENQHAIKHYETPRSEPHCLVVSLDTWSVWCYICDDEVQYSRTGNLAQLLTSIKKQSMPEPMKKTAVKEEKVEEDKQTTKSVKTEDEGKESKDSPKKNAKKESAVKSQKPAAGEDSGAVAVKGLSNLGNTCFFNAVIQNLSQTQQLREVLHNVTQANASLHITPCASLDLEPLEVQLDQPGSLTLAMCQLLNEIQESKRQVVTPRELFSQVCKKAARFKGFQQQDSQELLRYLLDGMRAEEMKRVGSGILEVLKKTGKNMDGEQSKRILKEYEKNAAPKNFVDHVFGGEMTSTVMCQECKTVSSVTEMFLDLSLPVSDEALRKKKKGGNQKVIPASQGESNDPVLTNGNEDMPTGAGSKYQQKKAKKQAKKQAKNQRRQQKQAGKITLDSLNSDPAENTQEYPTDQENGEKAGSVTSEEVQGNRSNSPKIGGPKEEAAINQADREQEEAEDSAIDFDSSSTSAVSNRFTILSNAPIVKNEESGDEEPSEVEQQVDEEDQLAGELESLDLNEGFLADPNGIEEGMETRNVPEEAKEYTVVSQDPELAFQTLAARVSPENQECSAESCLFQFTEVENLTQNNRLLCVTCAKQQPKINTSEGTKKSVYTDALKQMLISSPPSVLTLHLKRFQQIGYSVCKVNRHVQFPQILDLAPFCAAKCKNVPEGGTQVLYSLYGIVEHSGTMRSGHYTAYVKVLKGPKHSANGLTASGDSEPPRGSWFHISDTSVRAVPESKVQGSQAYLLFYERIQ